MKLLIGRVQVEVLGDSPDLDAMPQGQATTYKLLRELATLEAPCIEVKKVLERLQLRSVRPLNSRLEHLQERGLVKLTTLEPAVSP